MGADAPAEGRRIDRWASPLARTGLAAIGVAALLALLTVPPTLARWWLSQDAIEHLAIAHAWVNGAGFVDPVQWSYSSHGAFPFPALAMRAPAISALVAIPLALGATLTQTMVAHALFASCVAGALVVAARRAGLRMPAALAAALVFATTPAWLSISRHVWTEAAALLAFLLVLGTARGAAQSTRGALVCSAATFLASLCRPNLVALALAVVVAGLWSANDDRARAARAATTREPLPEALRSTSLRPLALYVGSLVSALLAYRFAVVWTTGEAPSSRYAALFQVLTTTDVWDYGRVYPGVGPFVASHLPELVERALATARDFGHALFLERTHHGLGWLALPGFAWALVRADEHALERRFLALSGAGLAVVPILYLDFDRVRFPIFTTAAAALCGAAWLDDVARRIGRLPAPGANAHRPTALVGALPLVLLAAPLVLTLYDSVAASAQAWRAYRSRGTREHFWPGRDAQIRPLCSTLAPGAVVASFDPWAIHLWCGHASMILPRDLAIEDRLETFLEREGPAFLVAPERYLELRHSVRLHAIAHFLDVVVYAVESESPSSAPQIRSRESTPAEPPVPMALRHWSAPPPLACAGRGRDCETRLNASMRRNGR